MLLATGLGNGYPGDLLKSLFTRMCISHVPPHDAQRCFGPQALLGMSLEKTAPRVAKDLCIWFILCSI